MYNYLKYIVIKSIAFLENYIYVHIENVLFFAISHFF